MVPDRDSPAAGPPVTYWLDARDVIEAVSEASWDAFAAANDGDAAASRAILGRPLMHFIEGDSARMWVNSLLSFVRVIGKPVRREYRCDSPAERRFMVMEVHPLDADRLRVDHYFVRSEPAEAPIGFLAARDPDESAASRCSVCNRISIRGIWVEPHPLAAEFGEPAGAAVLPVVYTVCPACQDGLMTPAGGTAPAP